jgi:iron complex transport system substrate-binding protein
VSGKDVVKPFLILMFFLLPSVSAGERPLRLISLAPSLTEMVFALGAGEQLVGVTEHCRYPSETASLAKIGGYQAPNFEAILALRPDLILALDEHSPSFPVLDSIGIGYERFDHRTLPGLLDSLVRLGKICRRQEQAERMRAELADGLSPPEGYRLEDAPGLLFVIGREYGKGVLADAIVVGKDALYENLIAAVGCRNAYRGDLPYPGLSGEGVALLDPDIIVEGVYAEMGTTLDAAALRRDWLTLPHLAAVREGRIYYLRSDYVFIPGYRLLLLKRELAAIVAACGLAGPKR